MILCGFFCAGKSTIGKRFAERFNLPFFDTDRMMEAQYGEPNSKIWRELGEEAFRDLETEVVKTLEPGGVIAIGGGTLLRKVNRELLKTIGTPIYLKASIEKLFSRMLKRGYPSYLDEIEPFKSFEKIAIERFEIYEAYCEHSILTETLTEEQIVDELAKSSFIQFDDAH